MYSFRIRFLRTIQYYKLLYDVCCNLRAMYSFSIIKVLKEPLNTINYCMFVVICVLCIFCIRFDTRPFRRIDEIDIMFLCTLQVVGYRIYRSY